MIRSDHRLQFIWRRLNAKPPDEAGHDAAHDVEHLLRVALWTCRIVAAEAPGAAGEDFIAPIAAALLHDWVNLPKNHPDRAQASSFSAAQAEAISLQAGFTEEQSGSIARAVRTHSYSRNEAPHDLLGRALQDADRIDALGAIGISRCLAVSMQLGAVFLDADDPWARRRALNDVQFTVDHFFTKLFKLPGLMNTETGEKEAAKRVGVMRNFLDHLSDECGAERFSEAD